tara:strand:+ start:6893 stop:8020 length:1128 start_codon:yes stop_codon:yes gene_type:complete
MSNIISRVIGNIFLYYVSINKILYLETTIPILIVFSALLYILFVLGSKKIVLQCFGCSKGSWWYKCAKYSGYNGDSCNAYKETLSNINTASKISSEIPSNLKNFRATITSHTFECLKRALKLFNDYRKVIFMIVPPPLFMPMHPLRKFAWKRLPWGIKFLTKCALGTVDKLIGDKIRGSLKLIEVAADATGFKFPLINKEFKILSFVKIAFDNIMNTIGLIIMSVMKVFNLIITLVYKYTFLIIYNQIISLYNELYKQIFNILSVFAEQLLVILEKIKDPIVSILFKIPLYKIFIFIKSFLVTSASSAVGVSNPNLVVYIVYVAIFVLIVVPIGSTVLAVLEFFKSLVLSIFGIENGEDILIMFYRNIHNLLYKN